MTEEKMEYTEIEVLELIKDGWEGGLGGSIWAHFHKGNKSLSMWNGTVYQLLKKGFVRGSDEFSMDLTITPAGFKFLEDSTANSINLS